MNDSRPRSPSPVSQAPLPSAATPSFAPGRSPELEREAQSWLFIAVGTLLFCGSCLSSASIVLFYLAILAARGGAVDEAGVRILWGKRITLGGLALSAIGALVAAVTYVL